MSVTSLGIVGGFAGTALSQRAAEADKVPSDAADRGRSLEGAQRAEEAAGIGRTEEDAETSERDADGRRPWEQSLPAKARPPVTQPVAPAPQLAKDPTGNCGTQLDLTG